MRPARPVAFVPMHPQTHGGAEEAVQGMIDQNRKLNFVLEMNCKIKVAVGSTVIHRLVEHAAVLLNRHQVGHDGKTPCRCVHQREFPTIQLDFSEQIMKRFALTRIKAT